MEYKTSHKFKYVILRLSALWFRSFVFVAFCLFLFGFFYTLPACSQPTCEKYPLNFSAGEQLTYVVSYNWFVLWTEVGEVTFKVDESTLGKKQVYHLSGTGSTYPSWDLFFKVRDRYESWIDTETLKPYYFKRMVREGGYEIDIRYIFNRYRNYALSSYIVNKKPEEKDTLAINDCTFDVMSVLYYARSLDYSKLTPGEIIPFTILLDRKLEKVYFRYLGTEPVKVKKIGELKCIKLSVYLVAGSVFKGGENMFVWLTDDKNKLPVYVETPIIVGSVKVKLVSFDGLKYPLTSIIPK